MVKVAKVAKTSGGSNSRFEQLMKAVERDHFLRMLAHSGLPIQDQRALAEEFGKL